MAAPDTEPRPPEDYSRFLATGEPLFIVGGQAVNLWALYYHEATISLAPFVSRDVDVLGDRQTLRAIAELAGLKPHFFPLKPPSNEVGYIMPNDLSGRPIILEVLRWVNGVGGGELNENSVTFGVGPNGVIVRVPSPVTLLKAKLANLETIEQEGRQDAKHVRILFRLLPDYLNDLIKTVGDGLRTERALVDILGKLLEIVTADSAKRLLSELGLDARLLFSRLPNEGYPKVTAFMQHQLPRWF